MTRLIDQYKEEACRFDRGRGADAPEEWAAVYDWWPTGRQLFEAAFVQEAGKRPLQGSTDDLLSAAIPKNLGDLARKEEDDAYYGAHASLFLAEMDHIVRRVARNVPEPAATFAYGNVLRFAHQVLFDSVVLFEHWAARSLGVPDVFGVGKNEVEHMHTFFFGAQQAIYGHGSFGLSFVENHSDLVTATIRQAIEIRLRRAFGVVGRISDRTQALEPIPLSVLFEAIRPHEGQITTAVPMHLLRRINGWANMYLHGAVKLPIWTPPRVLERLRPLLLGIDTHGVSGVCMSRATLEAVRQNLRDRFDSSPSPVGFLNESLCAAIITP